LAVLGGGLGGCWQLVFEPLAWLAGPAAALLVLALAVLATIAVLVVRIVKSYRSGFYVAITPAGIRGRSLAGAFLVPWDQFGYVQKYEFAPTVFGTDARGVPFREQIVGVLRSRREFDAFDAAAEAAFERYAGRARPD
jgi:hypothetical protein